MTSSIPLNLIPHGTLPLSIEIRGHGSPSGKTTLQLLLADFLVSRGHRVFLSDSDAGASILSGAVTRHQEKPAGVVPMPVYVHVNCDDAFLVPLGKHSVAPREYFAKKDVSASEPPTAPIA